MKKMFFLLLPLSIAVYQPTSAEEFESNWCAQSGIQNNHAVARSLAGYTTVFSQDHHMIWDVWSFIEQSTHTENVKGIDPVYLTVDHQWSF